MSPCSVMWGRGGGDSVTFGADDLGNGGGHDEAVVVASSNRQSPGRGGVHNEAVVAVADTEKN
jgi:hypothetical protein